MIALGDGIAGMHGVRGAALVLSDLPSGETQATFDRRPDMPRFWDAAWQALRNDGAAVLIRFAAALNDSQPKAFRYDLIWEKSNATGFLNASHRPLRAHEFVLVFYRELGTYNLQMLQGFPPVHKNSGRGKSGENYGASGGQGAGRSRAGATDRFPRSVLHFDSLGTRDPLRSHPQQKPESLLRWLIRTYSNPGDLVVDPFAGSGSAERAALAEGRRFAGWDSDPRFGSPAPGAEVAA